MLGTSIESKDTLEIIGGIEACENCRIPEINEFCDYERDSFICADCACYRCPDKKSCIGQCGDDYEATRKMA